MGQAIFTQSHNVGTESSQNSLGTNLTIWTPLKISQLQVQTNLIDSILDDETAKRKILTVGHGNPMGMIMFWDKFCYWQLISWDLPSSAFKASLKTSCCSSWFKCETSQSNGHEGKMRQKCWNKILPCYEKNKK